MDASGAIVRAASGLPVFNGVLYARLRPGEVDTRIDKAKAWCAARTIALSWYVGPTSTPADLGARLASHGMTPTDPWAVGMARRLDAALPEPAVSAGHTLERATDAAGLGGVALAVVGGFGMDAELVAPVTQFLIALAANDSPWRFYLARDGGAAVATAGLFLGSEVAGIYIVATVPEARRPGAGGGSDGGGDARCARLRPSHGGPTSVADGPLRLPAAGVGGPLHLRSLPLGAACPVRPLVISKHPPQGCHLCRLPPRAVCQPNDRNVSTMSAHTHSR